MKTTNSSKNYLGSRFSNGFVGACIAAYNGHHHLSIGPDEVWVTITSSLSRYSSHLFYIILLLSNFYTIITFHLHYMPSLIIISSSRRNNSRLFSFSLFLFYFVLLLPSLFQQIHNSECREDERCVRQSCREDGINSRGRWHYPLC